MIFFVKIKLIDLKLSIRHHFDSFFANILRKIRVEYFSLLGCGVLCGAFLLCCLLGRHENFLELLLEGLDCVLFVRDLALELVLKGLKTGNLLVDEGNTLRNYIFALEDGLLGEDGAHHFEHIGVIVEHLELSHDHLILALFLRHFLFVNDNFAVLCTQQGGSIRVS